MQLQRLTPDTDKDSGTCSPYGILDWSDPHKTRLPTTVDCTVPDATCFDMGLLKAELCSTSGTEYNTVNIVCLLPVTFVCLFFLAAFNELSKILF